MKTGNTPDDFFDRGGVKPPPNHSLAMCRSAAIASSLINRGWGEEALHEVLLHGPSCIRVLWHNEGETLDCCDRRVTVRLNDNDLIESVTMELMPALEAMGDLMRSRRQVTHDVRRGLSIGNPDAVARIKINDK